jgi:hypothetical protein
MDIPPAVNGPVRKTPLERVRQSYSSVPQRILVPEWADEQGNPMEIFYTPITGIDDQTIEAREPKSNAERLVYRLILKSRDDNGRALFRWNDAPVLLKEVPYELLARVVLRIMGIAASGLGPTVEDAKAELEADPNYISGSSSP